MNKDKALKFYCVFKNEDHIFELWAGPVSSKKAALSSGEMEILDIYGSKSKKYMERLNGLTVVNESEAKYLRII
jgi:hypothetical protein